MSFGTYRGSLALFALSMVAALLCGGDARADWSDNFNGNVAHNPPNGAWGYLGLSLPQGAEVSDWAPVYANNRVNVPPTFNGVPTYLAAGYVGSEAAQHEYGDVRVAGLAGVNLNGVGANNNLVGMLARAADFDSYVLAIDHRLQSAVLVKSLDSQPNDPITVASQPIFGYLAGMDFYLQLDVQDISGGTRLVGKVYDETRSTLLTTLFAFDDFGDTVLGPPHEAYYSGWVAQYNQLAGSAATTVDAFFDDMSSKTLRPGDVNLDGTINRRDVSLLVQNFGKATNATWDDGDLDGDGKVGLADLAIVQQRFTSSGGPIIVPPPVDIAADAAAVPEPASLTMLGACGIFGVAASMARRRRISNPRR
jgi:hypothetical protein